MQKVPLQKADRVFGAPKKVFPECTPVAARLQFVWHHIFAPIFIGFCEWHVQQCPVAKVQHYVQSLITVKGNWEGELD
jgi:hypothetical protein